MNKYRNIIPRYDEFLEAITKRKPFEFRVNTIKSSINEIKEFLEQNNIKYRQRDFDKKYFISEKNISTSLPHWLGLFYVQEFTSAIPVKALEVRENESILDMCAAPGSKTTQMAAEMQNRGEIIANEPVTNRIKALMGNIYKQGVLNTQVIQYNGQVLPENKRFDKILVDAPCSGEGNIRKEEKNKIKDHNNRESLIKTQNQLLEKAINLIKPNGEIVYSTCTFSPKENEEIIQKHLNKKIELIDLEFPFKHSKGLHKWKNKEYESELNKTIRIYPHQLNSGGIFIAKIKKKS